MDSLHPGWFSELNDEIVPGQSFSLQVDHMIHEEKSQYQKIQIFKRYK